ncbi:MAG: alpha-1,2-fucosyltransferase [Deltaproteobacteria bacterium]|nr:alpha-1,2-fucosyltransferase [Deltaproteobacteria bacterium]
MIITKLYGGLGNQLFQYATGRSLAERHGVELKMDISFFQKQSLRGYALGAFNIAESFATKEECAPFLQFSKKERKKKNLLEKFFKRKRVSPYYNKEKKLFTFDPDILKSPDGSCLDGYWQTELYFKDYEQIIREEFTLKEKETGKNLELVKIMAEVESVSLHIRRGDYIGDEAAKKQIGFCGLDYYERAVRVIEEKVASPRFFIFSDDPEWVAENLKLSAETTSVNHNGSDNAHEDLRLMSKCKHHIIANSTFSWWGAWLGKNPDKIIIAPKRWLATEKYKTTDLFPDGWLKL